MQSFILSAVIGGILALIVALTKTRPGWRIAGILGIIVFTFYSISERSIRIWSLEGIFVTGFGLLAGYCIYIAFEHVFPQGAAARFRSLRAHDWWLGAALIGLVLFGLLTPHLDRLIRNMTMFSAGGIELQFADSVKTTETLLREDTRDYQTSVALKFAFTLRAPIKSEVDFLNLQAGQPNLPPELKRKEELLIQTSRLIESLADPIWGCVNEATQTRIDPELIRDALREQIHMLTRLADERPAPIVVEIHIRHAQVYQKILEAHNRLAALIGESSACSPVTDTHTRIWPPEIRKLHEITESPYLYTFLAYLNVYVENVGKAIQLLKTNTDKFPADINLHKLLYSLLYFEKRDFTDYQKYAERALNIAERQCRLISCGSDKTDVEIAIAFPWLKLTTVAHLRNVAERRVMIVKSDLAYFMAQALAAGEEGAADYKGKAVNLIKTVVDKIEDNRSLQSMSDMQRELSTSGFYDTYAFVLMTFEMIAKEPNREVIDDIREALVNAKQNIRQVLNSDPGNEQARRQQRSIRSHYKRMQAFAARL